MQKTTFFLIAILICISLYGQKSTAISLNISESNNNYQFHKIFNVDPEPFEILIPAKSTQLGLSIAKQYNSGRLFEIMMVTGFQRNFTRIIYQRGQDPMRSSYTSRRGDIHLRVEYGKVWQMPNHPKLLLGLSGSTDPRYTFSDYTPQKEGKFPARFRTYEIAINLIPRFSYNINNRILATFKLPLETLSLVEVLGTYSDPSLTTAQQRVGASFFDIFHMQPTYHFSIGYFFSHEDRKKDHLSFFTNNNIF